MPRANAPQEKWTDDRVELLMELAKKHSASVIALKLNEKFGTFFTRNSVIGACQRRKIKLAGSMSDETLEYYRKKKVASQDRKKQQVERYREARAVATTTPRIRYPRKRHKEPLQPVEEALPPAEEVIPEMIKVRVPVSTPVNTCRWIFGDPRDKDAFWCDQPVSKDISGNRVWCRYHQTLVYNRAA